MKKRLESTKRTKEDDNSQIAESTNDKLGISRKYHSIFKVVNVITTILTICLIFTFILLADSPYFNKDFTWNIRVILIPTSLLYLIKFVIVIIFAVTTKNTIVFFNELRNLLLNLSFFIPAIIIDNYSDLNYSVLNYIVYFLSNILIYSIYFIIFNGILKRKKIVEYSLIFVISLLALSTLFTSDSIQVISVKMMIIICLSVVGLNVFILLTTKNKSWNMIVVLNLLLSLLKFSGINWPTYLILTIFLFIVINILDLIFIEDKIKWPSYIHNLIFMGLAFSYINNLNLMLKLPTEIKDQMLSSNLEIFFITSLSLIFAMLQKSISDNKNISMLHPQTQILQSNLPINKISAIFALVMAGLMLSMLIVALNVSAPSVGITMIVTDLFIITILISIPTLALHIIGVKQSNKHNITNSGHKLGVVGAGLFIFAIFVALITEFDSFTLLLWPIAWIFIILASIFVLIAKPKVNDNQYYGRR